MSSKAVHLPHEVKTDISIPEAEQMTQGARMAFGGHPADEFLEHAFKIAADNRKERRAKQTKFTPKTAVSY